MTTESVVTPSRLGIPCWTPESLANAVRPIAQVDPERADVFMACHAPIAHIQEVRTGTLLRETEVYESLIRAIDREVFVIVKGEPGTGKSHLINWLKLRYDRASHDGDIEAVLPVLIQRRSGSLKDALDQLIHQLPKRFHKYLNPVQEAIGKISTAAARETLAHFIGLNLGIRWREEGRPPRERQLKYLEDLFAGGGFRQWLCRNEGVIAKNIDRLISRSDVEERQTIPEFRPEELLLQDKRLRANVTPRVAELMLDLEDDPQYRIRAAEYCNSVLRRALRDLTGLGNQQLAEIFRNIRRDLKKTGERLVLFIEDVSTMSVLDDEIVNAVEPQNDSGLCPLTSVIGMVDSAFARLRDNQVQRATKIVSMGGSSNAEWRQSGDDVDRFVGRYLNAIRLKETALAKLARKRLAGGDIAYSACQGCPINHSCFSTFGNVDIDGVAVGLFPFRKGAARRLLEQLDETIDGVEITQRGLLRDVVTPALRDVELISEGKRSRQQFPIREHEPKYWSGFENDYCGGWSSADKARMKVLAFFWTEAESKEQAAAALQPLLEPFGFRKFSKAAPRELPKDDREKQPPQRDEKSKKAPRADERRVSEVRDRLDKWLDGATLQPQEPQDLVLQFLKQTIAFDDLRWPYCGGRSFIQDGNRGIIRFERSATRAATTLFGIDLPCTDETRALVLALARFKYLGENTWDFEDGEVSKREAYRWLRRHQEEVLRTLNSDGLDVGIPTTTATELLAVASFATRKAGLANELGDAVETLMTVTCEQPPPALSSKLRSVYDDLPQRVRDAKDFLLRELDAPQGTGGILFVDPVPLLAILPQIRVMSSISQIGPRYFESYWKSRFAALIPFNDGAWARLGEATEDERASLKAAVEVTQQQFRKEGYIAEEIDENVDHFVADVMELRQALIEVRHPVPHDTFDRMVPQLGLQKAAVASALRNAHDIVVAGSMRDILIHDAEKLQGAQTTIRYCAEFLRTARQDIDTWYSHVTQQGDPDAIAKQLIEMLDEIVNLAAEPGGGGDGTS